MRPVAIVLLTALALAGCTGDDGATSTTGTSPVTTSPVTTSPVTTSPVTTSPATTSPATTSPALSSPRVPEELSGVPVRTALLDGQQILVAIAATDATRVRGLMGVADLGDLFGMVFVFPEARQTSFWMGDVPIPLDVAFFDGEGGYIDGFTMSTCLDGECGSYPTPGLVSLAIEAPAGTLGGLGPGSVLLLDG